ncbi:MAG: hypothetical protein M3071_13065 [Actinomycetota bacterium]|nr:hypothetical protein [Actinomycetota bacterium]
MPRSSTAPLIGSHRASRPDGRSGRRAAAHRPARSLSLAVFAEDLTQTEIARRIGISQIRVSRLLRRSVQRLQEKLTDKAQPLDTYR